MLNVVHIQVAKSHPFDIVLFCRVVINFHSIWKLEETTEENKSWQSSVSKHIQVTNSNISCIRIDDYVDSTLLDSSSHIPSWFWRSRSRLIIQAAIEIRFSRLWAPLPTFSVYSPCQHHHIRRRLRWCFNGLMVKSMTYFPLSLDYRHTYRCHRIAISSQSKHSRAFRSRAVVSVINWYTHDRLVISIKTLTMSNFTINLC